MVKDAEANAAEDKKRRDLVEAKNRAEGMIHDVEKNVKEHGDKIGADKAVIESAIADLKAVKDGDDLEAIKAKTDALSQASMKLGEAMYKAAQAEAAGAAAGGAEAPKADPAKEAPKDEKVVDATFEDVSDKNKKN